jgi:AcrR family transcriptional regulator
MDAKPYHHGDLRQALIQAGLEATRLGGPDALRLRDLGRVVGVSANAVYRHFEDRDALLDAVAAEILATLAREMRTHEGARIVHDGAIQRLRSVGLAYIAFARREPGWFSVAFFGAGRDGLLATPPAPPYMALTEALDDLVTEGVLSGEGREGAQWLCWCAVHGFADLVLHGPLRHSPDPEVDRLAERTVDAIIAGVIDTGWPAAARRTDGRTTDASVQRSAREPAMPPTEK